MIKSFIHITLLAVLLSNLTSCNEDSFLSQKVKTSNGITTVSDIQAGELENTILLSMRSITHLVLDSTCTIDSRDFQTLRDEMPKLTILDISKASIAAYSGLEGSGGDRVHHYDANKIPDFAFYNPETFVSKTSLTTVILPENISSIRNYAFHKCTGLSGTLIIPSSVKDTIGMSAFSFCENITRLTLSPTRYIGESAFQGCTKLEGTLAIPDSVVKIAAFAFAGCSKISSIETSSTVSYIGDYAFSECIALSDSIEIGENISYLGQSAFTGCTKITGFKIPSTNTNFEFTDQVLLDLSQGSVKYCIPTKQGAYTIPDYIYSIESNAFSGCSKLTAITINGNVGSIGANAFDGCTGLTHFYSQCYTPIDLSYTLSALNGINKTTCTLYIPTNTDPDTDIKSYYLDALVWQDFKNIVQMTY